MEQTQLPTVNASNCEDLLEVLAKIMEAHQLQNQFRIFQDYYRAKTSEEQVQVLEKWANIAWK